MTKMRAVLVKDGRGPSDALYIGEVDKPTAKEGEVIVKVLDCYQSSRPRSRCLKKQWPLR
jgi:hypothetical protein